MEGHPRPGCYFTEITQLPQQHAALESTAVGCLPPAACDIYNAMARR